MRLNYFAAVVREGGLACAAARLALTPQTLGRHMRLLEAELGTALFQRRVKPLQLTEDGLLLFLRLESSLVSQREASLGNDPTSFL